MHVQRSFSTSSIEIKPTSSNTHIQKCEEHENQPKLLYCLECQKALCPQCALMEVSAQKHRMLNLKLFQEYRDKQSNLKGIEQRLKDQIQVFYQEVQSAQQQQQLYNANLILGVNNLIKAILKYRKKHLVNISRQLQEYYQYFNQKIFKFQSQLDLVQKTIQSECTLQELNQEKLKQQMDIYGNVFKTYDAMKFEYVSIQIVDHFTQTQLIQNISQFLAFEIKPVKKNQNVQQDFMAQNPENKATEQDQAQESQKMEIMQPEVDKSEVKQEQDEEQKVETKVPHPLIEKRVRVSTKLQRQYSTDEIKTPMVATSSMQQIIDKPMQKNKLKIQKPGYHKREASEVVTPSNESLKQNIDLDESPKTTLSTSFQGLKKSLNYSMQQGGKNQISQNLQTSTSTSTNPPKIKSKLQTQSKSSVCAGCKKSLRLVNPFKCTKCKEDKCIDCMRNVESENPLCKNCPVK